MFCFYLVCGLREACGFWVCGGWRVLVWWVGPGWGFSLGGWGGCVWVGPWVGVVSWRGWVRCGGLWWVFAQTSRSPRVRLLVLVCLLGSFKFFSLLIIVWSIAFLNMLLYISALTGC